MEFSSLHLAMTYIFPMTQAEINFGRENEEVGRAFSKSVLPVDLLPAGRARLGGGGGRGQRTELLSQTCPLEVTQEAWEFFSLQAQGLRVNLRKSKHCFALLRA